MKKTVVAAVSAILALCCLSGVFASADGIFFSDVRETDWFSEYVRFVVDGGYMIGTSGTKFSPDESTTRAQIVTVLSRMTDDPVDGLGKTLSFTDTPAGEWYADYVGWAVSSGVAQGYPDGSFRPDEPVLRQELAVILKRFIDYRSLSLADGPLIGEFTDARSIPDWAAEYVEAMRNSGIISGDDRGRFNPGATATRAEIAVVIKRFVEKSSAPDPMHDKLKNIASLVDATGRYVNIDLYCRDRIVGTGTSKSLSALLLPQMGLDTDVYEILIDPNSYYDLIWSTDCSFTGDELTNNFDRPGAENACGTRLAIRNNVTGETTPYRTVLLNVRRSLGPTVIDPDGFEPGVDPELWAKMREMSVYGSDTTGRFKAVFEKAARGEPVTSLFIGGSVTARASAGDDHCYPMLVYNWLAKTYPESEMTYVNQGIASTSVYAILRYGQCVRKYSPDLVFIEFGQNDTSTAAQREAFESFIRRSLDDGSAVMIVLTGIAHQKNCVYMKEVADRYGIPLCDVRSGADLALSEGAIFDFELAYDGGHPREWGHNHIADMIVYGLRSIAADETPAPDEYVMPERITGAETEDFTYVLAEDITEELPLGWSLSFTDSKFIPRLEAVDEADPLTFEVECRELYLLTFANYSFLVSVDGGEFVTIGDDYSYKLFSYDESALHTVTIVTAGGGEKARVCGYTYR